VEGHRANLTEKLGIRSRVDLLRYARERGLM
jgi:DNA-binding CsgD family transcriptional regulator